MTGMIDWSREFFDKLEDDNLWVMPRSGMVFWKWKNLLLWIGTIPPKDKFDLPISEVREIECDMVWKNFGAVSVTVCKMGELEEFDNIDEAIRHRDTSELFVMFRESAEVHANDQEDA